MSLKEKYISEIRVKLQDSFHYKSAARAPRFTKVLM